MKIENEDILPIDLQKEYLLKADSVIVSSESENEPENSQEPPKIEENRENIDIELLI